MPVDPPPPGAKHGSKFQALLDTSFHCSGPLSFIQHHHASSCPWVTSPAWQACPPTPLFCYADGSDPPNPPKPTDGDPFKPPKDQLHYVLSAFIPPTVMLTLFACCMPVPHGMALQPSCGGCSLGRVPPAQAWRPVPNSCNEQKKFNI